MEARCDRLQLCSATCRLSPGELGSIFTSLAGKGFGWLHCGGGGALAPAPNPPEAQRELITVYVCTVISHEPLCLWNSQADCWCVSTLFCRRRSLQRNTLDRAYYLSFCVISNIVQQLLFILLINSRFGHNSRVQPELLMAGNCCFLAIIDSLLKLIHTLSDSKLNAHPSFMVHAIVN